MTCVNLVKIYKNPCGKKIWLKNEKKGLYAVRKLIDEGYNTAKNILTEKLNDLHKLAKALLTYETLSGEEIKDLILNDVQPKRAKDSDDIDKEKTSALGSLGLKPKPAL